MGTMKLSRLQIARIGWALTAVLTAVVYGLVRLPELNVGFPYIYYWDEWQISSSQLSTYITKNPTIYFFNYGNFPAYFSSLASLIPLLGIGVTPIDLTAGPLFQVPGYEWTLGIPEVLLVGRFLWLIVGFGALVSTAIIAHSIGGRSAAVVAGVLVALNPFVAIFNSRITPDGIGAPLAIMAIALLVLCVTRKASRSSVVLAGMLAGFATASKYIYGAVFFSFFLLLAHHWKANKSLGVTHLGSGLAAGIAAFALGNASMFLEPQRFLGALLYEWSHYQTGGAGVHKSEPWLGNLRYQLGELATNWGGVPLVFAAIGLLFWLWTPRRRGFIALSMVVSPPLIILLVLISGELNFHRNVLILYFAISVLAAIGIQSSSTFLAQKFAELWAKKAVRDAVAGRLVTAVFVSVFTIVSSVSMSAANWADYKRWRGFQDSRNLALEWSCARDISGQIFVDRALAISTRITPGNCEGVRLVASEVPLPATESGLLIVPEDRLSVGQSSGGVVTADFGSGSGYQRGDDGLFSQPLIDPKIYVIRLIPEDPFD